MATLPSPRIDASAEPTINHQFRELASQPWNARFVARRRVAEREASHWLTRLQHYALFSNISPRERQEIVSVARYQELSRGKTIYLEGDPAQQVVMLTSGSAKVVQYGKDGTEVIVRLCGPGELVGTLGLCPKGRHCATARALQPSEALIWDVGVFDFLSNRFPVLRFNTALILVKQLRDIEDRFREIATCRVAARLSRQIVRLMGQVGHRDNGLVEISISREELAQLIGTTLFTVSRLLSDWDKRGIVVARRNAVLVRDFNSLEGLADTESNSA